MSVERLKSFLIRLKEDLEYLENCSRCGEADAEEDTEKIHYLILDTEEVVEAAQGKRPWPVTE